MRALAPVANVIIVAESTTGSSEGSPPSPGAPSSPQAARRPRAKADTIVIQVTRQRITKTPAREGAGARLERDEERPGKLHAGPARRPPAGPTGYLPFSTYNKQCPDPLP